MERVIDECVQALVARSEMDRLILLLDVLRGLRMLIFWLIYFVQCMFYILVRFD